MKRPFKHFQKNYTYLSAHFLLCSVDLKSQQGHNLPGLICQSYLTQQTGTAWENGSLCHTGGNRAVNMMTGTFLVLRFPLIIISFIENYSGLKK